MSESRRWRAAERVMAVIGTVATLIGAVVSIYAFLFPADLTNIASQILQRMNATPVLGDSDRFTVDGVYCSEYSGTCDISIKKDVTAFAGSLLVSACSKDGLEVLHSKKLSFGRIGEYLSTEFPTKDVDLRLSLSVSAEGSDFAILERWSAENGTFSDWYRADVPSVQSGQIDCTSSA